MNRANSNKKKPASRDISQNLASSAVLRMVERRISATGRLELPCIPELVDWYTQKLGALWASLGKPFSADEVKKLREMVESGILMGFRASPYSLLVIEYKSQAPPLPALTYTAHVCAVSMVDHFTHWVEVGEGPLFGTHPDAKLVDLALTLGDPATVPLLDVGAGTGRNALALARKGHPATAVEIVPALAEAMRSASVAEGIPLTVIEGDIASPTLALPTNHYKLVVLAEVVTHFRNADQLRSAVSKFTDAVAPGGLLVFSAFLGVGNYNPDTMVRQAAEIAWSSLFARADFEFITNDFPFDRISDESVYDYERQHLPEEAWPPTAWFPAWSQGRNIFDLSDMKPPAELRWLVYRRR